MKHPALTLATLIMVAGCATQNSSPTSQDQPSGGNDCIFFSSLNSWTVLDRSHLIIWPSPKDAYLVDTGFPLEDLPWASAVVFVDGDHNGKLCGYGMDAIVVPHSNINNRATIASIRRVDEVELTKLSEQYHVKLTRTPKPAPGANTNTPPTDSDKAE
jgi:hypothetical protein